MPLLNTKPTKTFPEDFQHNENQIREYFAHAYGIADLFRKWRSKSKLRNVKKLCTRIALEVGKSPAYVNQAKKVAEAISRQQLDEILAACEKAEYLPSRETFIAWARVPAEYRPGFIEAAIEGKWSAARIKEETQQSFGIRSNGRRHAQEPDTLEEAITQVKKLNSRLWPLLECLREASRSETSELPVTPAIVQHGQNCLGSLNELRLELLAAAEKAAGRRTRRRRK